MHGSRHPNSTYRPCRMGTLSASLLLVVVAMGSAQANEPPSNDDLGVPQVAACSARYPLVASPRLGEPQGNANNAKQAIRQAFGTNRDWGTERNVELLSSQFTGLGESGLRVHYPKGTSSPGDTQEGGAGFYMEEPALSASDRACLEYSVRFEPGFDFVKGGKLPGLYGGEGPSGGDPADGENGFSMRFMWRENGQGELYEYVANLGGEGDYGASVGRGLWHFPAGEWVNIQQEVILNTPGLDDGIARVWINGEPVLEQQGIVYRTSESLTIDGLMFSSFFGGHGEGWRTPRDQSIDFAGFRLYAPR